MTRMASVRRRFKALKRRESPHGREADVASEDLIVVACGWRPTLGGSCQHLGQQLLRIANPLRIARQVGWWPLQLAASIGDGAKGR